MTLIKSISGIRGTIGGAVGENLTPLDTVKFAAGYAAWLKNSCDTLKPMVIVGRDARISGKMISSLVANTLVGMGIDVVDLGLSTTPTVEFAVPQEGADGGIIVTASHNPRQWNALKLLNGDGEFLNAEQGAAILNIVEQDSYEFSAVDHLGHYRKKKNYISRHVSAVTDLDLVNVAAIRKAGLKVVVDGVNSTGGIAIPALLEALGVTCIPLYCDPTGDFPHNPEPLAEHLTDIASMVVSESADLGIVVDPDVDRLAIICEDGSMFGEEYTLVACADYILKHNPGNTVSNLSSSRALRDVTESYGQQYSASAVGEVHVVAHMKLTDAVIGGEGNGGVIYPESHYGRDALVGVGLFLSHLVKTGVSCRELRSLYPEYHMSKNKLELRPEIDVDVLLKKLEAKYSNENLTTIDGVKIDFEKEWAHLRKSNTEPIIRIYAESTTQEAADNLAMRIMEDLKELF
jgi:phosphomannomutase